ncbi:Mitochondrial substrate/solute carrier [Macrophomina phaseolina MS6]|uniref:Mitochondrial substrate/solute carrier n=1 Tax=Macrophomina phaseolina (strain MS6) TaxID=1126212 RepID=K2QM18_MACPH|nr:Mitochondrial substrate/solute carrier [Macrophomina phaseolina MS6]
MLTCFSLADKTPRLPHHRRRDREARDAARSIQGPWSRGDGHRAQDGHPLHELRVVQAAARAQGRHRLWASNIYRDMWKQEGTRSFYKGITPRIMRVAPGQAVTFTVYEYLKGVLERGREMMPGGRYEE